jgi:ribosomal-protein-alanine N-acetyltransferase
MALLEWMSADHDLRLDGEGVRLRPHRASDFPEWSALREQSRRFLQPWEPTWPIDDLTRAAYRRRLAAYTQDIERGVAYPFLVFRRPDDRLVGGVTLANVRRGVAQMASVGYWVGEPFARQGHTVAAVRTVLDFAFERLALHRVEAACLPTNAASRGVLLKAGFREEGYARSYLKIDGDWRNHLLFGRLRGDEPAEATSSSLPPLAGEATRVSER